MNISTKREADGRPHWRGAFAALVTPFDRSGQLDEQALRDNLQMTVDDDAHGVMVGGQYGEGYSMSDDERRRLFEIAAETVGGRIPVIAATGHVATAAAIELTRSAKAAGVDGVMLDPPHYLLPKADEVVAHYSEICAAVDIPVKLCNSPGRSGFDLTPDIIERLLQIPQIVSIKHSGLDFERIMQLRMRFGSRLDVFIGPSRTFGLAGVLHGAAGFMDGLIQVAGRRPVELFEAAAAGDLPRAVKLQEELFLLGEAVYTRDGTTPATTKDAMRLVGRPGGWPRAPLRPLRGAALARLEQALRAAGVPLCQGGASGRGG